MIQKVLSAFLPLPQATSAKKLFLSSPSNPERPSKGTVALTYQQKTVCYKYSKALQAGSDFLEHQLLSDKVIKRKNCQQPNEERFNLLFMFTTVHEHTEKSP